MLYLVLIADSFAESAMEELGSASEYRIVAEHHNLVIADVDAGKMGKLDSARFIYACFPIYSRSGIDQGKYIESIYSQIYGLGIGRDVPVRVECFDINCKQGYSAKDIEVAVGGMLERDGFNVDIENPEVLAYAVLFNSECYSGWIRLGRSSHRFIDPFRARKDKLVSRAEFKITEAFEAFGPERPGIAIDIGAAPGGWSLFLAKLGAAVIAIDPGALEYGKIRAQGIGVTESDQMHAKVAQSSVARGSILHLRCGLDLAAGMLSGIRADMLTNDINVGGIRSSQAVMKYSHMMRSGAALIMTVKCMRRNVGRYIEEVETALGGEFTDMRWKVLPHDRQEITLFARKR